MKKALCWLSFDFDNTLTTVHTWKDLKLTTSSAANVTKAGSGLITLSDGLLLAKLIDYVCSRGMIFCITTMQNGPIVRAGMMANPRVKDVMTRHEGTRFFIIDRTVVRGASGKAPALRKLLKVTSEYSGIHFDDDPREATQFSAMGISFQEMTEKTGFSSSMQSSLCKAVSSILRNGFTHLGVAQNLPESIYANASLGSDIPKDHNFKFATRRSAGHPIGKFISDLMVEIMSS